MRDDRVYLQSILERIERIKSFTHGGRNVFLVDVMVQDAVIRNLEIIGEAAKHVSAALRTQHDVVPWRRIAGFRDVLIHGYLGVDLLRVWEVVEHSLVPLESEIRLILETLPDDFPEGN